MKNHTAAVPGKTAGGILTGLCVVLGVSSACAAVISNPVLATGPDAIDPPGGRNDLNLAIPGAASKTDLLNTPGFGVYGNLQTWFGVDFSVGTFPNATAVNIYTFADRPDFRTTFVGEPGRNAGSGTGAAAAYTSGPASPSGGESLFFGTSAANVWTVEFGSYDSETATFTPGVGVAAAGFTFSRNTAATAGTTWKAEFFDGEVSLSLQVVDAGVAQNVSGLFGYIAQPGETITRIVLGGPGTSYNDRNHFIDDFGFAAVPEPSTFALAGLGIALLALRRRFVVR